MRTGRLGLIQTIQDRYVNGEPIGLAGFGEKKLALMAKRHFGSWTDAVAAAGLSHKYTRRAPLRSWTKESVLTAIMTWHDQGRALTKISQQDQGLYCAARKCFGSFRTAVRAAGLELNRTIWPKKRVLAEIRVRCSHGHGLTRETVYDEDPALVKAATRLFGGWGQALDAAGVSPKSSRSHGKRKSA